MYELIYTSVPRGLLPGRSGYATVAYTVGMPPNLILPVENLSGYTFTLRNGQFSPEYNPVSCSYRKVRFGNKILRVASRIAPCGLDYSGRNNKIAHHLIFTDNESPDAVAEAFLTDGIFRTEFREEPHRLPTPPRLPGATFAPPARTWAMLTGDAGYAAMVALRLLTPGSKPFYLAYPAATETAVLVTLAAEVAALLTPEERERFTFTTYFDREQPGEDCFLRMVPDFSPALGNLRKFHQNDLLDLCLPAPPLPPELAENELVNIARRGRMEMIELVSLPTARPEDPELRPPVQPVSPADAPPSRIPERTDFIGVRIPRTAGREARGPARERSIRSVPGRVPAGTDPSGQWSGWKQAIMLSLVAAMLIFLLYLAFRPMPKPEKKTGDAPQNTASERTVPEPIAAASRKNPAALPKSTGPDETQAGSGAPSSAARLGADQPVPSDTGVGTSTAPPNPEPAAAKVPASTAASDAEAAASTTTPAPAAARAAPKAAELKTADAAPRRNLTDAEWKQARPLWKSKPAPSMSFLKSWRENIDRSKAFEIELPTGVPKWDRFDVNIAGIGGRAVADPAAFIDCPNDLAVHIRAAVKVGDALRPDPDPNAALKLVFDRTANKLKVSPASKGKIRPSLSDVTAICFFHEISRTCYLWKPQFFEAYLSRIKPGTAAMDSKGKLSYRPSEDEKLWRKDIAIRLGEFPEDKLPQLPLKEWNDTVGRLAGLRTAHSLGENGRELARTKDRLKVLRQKIQEDWKKISPKLPELPQFARLFADGQEQPVVPGEALRGVDWSQWVTHELKPSH